MQVVQVNDFPDAEFEVSILSSTNTFHRVQLSEDYYKILTDGKVDAKDLIVESFRFLLEREPNTSILSDFELRRIKEYYPEYEDSIRSKIAGDN